jgi:hypothetical protein
MMNVWNATTQVKKKPGTVTCGGLMLGKSNWTRVTVPLGRRTLHRHRVISVYFNPRMMLLNSLLSNPETI